MKAERTTSSSMLAAAVVLMLMTIKMSAAAPTFSDLTNPGQGAIPLQYYYHKCMSQFDPLESSKCTVEDLTIVVNEIIGNPAATDPNYNWSGILAKLSHSCSEAICATGSTFRWCLGYIMPYNDRVLVEKKLILEPFCAAKAPSASPTPSAT